MNTNVGNVELVDRIGQSALTIRIKNVRAGALSRVWKAQSQPAKLLILGLLVMSCLCGSIYYGTVVAGSSAEQVAPEAK